MSRPQASVAATLFVVFVACAFAIGAVLAKLAYDAGSNAITVVSVRTLAACAWLMIAMTILRVPMSLPPPLRGRALALGVLLAANMMGMYTAIQLMPPPLAVLTFYLYPFFTMLVEAGTGRERLEPRKVIALVVAFAGLAIMLTTGSLAPTAMGVLTATLGALAFTAVLVLTGRLFPPGDSRPRTVHMTASAGVLLAAIALATGSFAAPTTPLGWIGLAGVCVSFPIAIIGLFVAVGMVGPTRTSILMNTEPVAVTVFSALILDQVLAGTQVAGGALVVGAILALQWPEHRRT